MSKSARAAFVAAPERALQPELHSELLPPTVVFFDHTAKWSGGEISLFNLVTHLDRTRFRPVVVLFEDGTLRHKLDAAAIATHVISLDEGLNSARKDALGLKAALAPRQIKLVLRHLRALRRVLQQEGAGIAHCNSLKADILGGLAARSLGIPTIWHIRDRIAEDYLPARTTKVFRLLARLIPTQIITVSGATLEALRLPPRFLKSGRAVAIHNGTRLEAFSALEPRLNPGPIVIGMVGRLAKWKGQHVFLEAAAIVRKRFPDVRFQIVGSALFAADANYAAQLRDQARDLKLEDAVEWLGFRADVPRVVAQMDILAHASTTGEPFGQVIIEGMAAGKPVVATNGGGVPEIVEAGVTGYLVPRNNAPALAAALIQFCAEPETALRMGEAGRKRALENFGIDVTVARVEGVYQNLLGVPVPSPALEPTATQPGLHAKATK